MAFKQKNTKQESDDEDSSSVYDSGAEEQEVDEEYDSDAPESESDSDDTDEDDDDDDDDGEDFEDQGSSDDEDDILQNQIKAAKLQDDDESEDELEIIEDFETIPRSFAPLKAFKRNKDGKIMDAGNKEDKKDDGFDDPAAAQLMHTDDLSSDDEDVEGEGNRIGRVPLHWYDEYDHIGYNVHGKKITKQSANGDGGDLLDKALQNQDDLEKKKFVVYDALNDKNVELTERQLQIIRRVQAGAFAHPEHDANPDYIAYYSGVDQQISGINSDRHEPKARFQPSKYEKAQVRQLLKKLQDGVITMDFLTGKVRDMNDVTKKKKDGDTDKPFLMWNGDEEDELYFRKGPMHIAAPKLPPPTHAESYNPPEEYLPTEEDIKQWEEMDVKDRPHGLLIPKKFSNLRSVGAYEHAVRERFERCLDLYLCPRVMKRRLNIDPESLVPSLPKASDLRPFPTSKCIEFETPHDGDQPPMIRCLTVSPDGQYMASGASDGYVRIWEVQTGRLLKSWDVSSLIAKTDDDLRDGDEKDEQSNQNVPKPVVSIEWNPNRSHHCILAAVGKCAIVIATGTGGQYDAELTEALLAAATSCSGDGKNVKNAKAKKSVTWKSISADELEEDGKPISAFGGICGPVVALYTTKDVAAVKWHKKGDYFLTVSPKAMAASVLIHQLNKATSQQPFSKNKGGEVQRACFHPNKPFLFVATKENIRVYHLVKQSLVKRLLSGCKWISSMDIHPSGDHIIVGSLDRRMVWFDLDLSATPYKTLRYHEKALRQVSFHPRYPLMASSSDDGSVHVFHSMVYSDLMRNPLIVPVKILRGHSVVGKLGVIACAFHPTQPWLFSAGADGKIHLYQDI
jgi:ribosome biogenesis protein ERB1